MKAAATGSRQGGRRRLFRLLFVCVAQIVVCGLAWSQDSKWIDRWGGSLTLTNDYVYRGVSLSEGEASVQGGLHAGVGSHFNVGVFAASVKNERTRGAEAEVSGSISGTWRPATDWTLRAAWSHFIYTGPPAPFNYDYDEVTLSAAYRSNAVLAVSWLPNVQGFDYASGRRRDSATAIDLTGSWPLVQAWSLAVGLGYYDLSELYGTGYGYWHGGTTGSVGPIEIDLLYIGSDHRAGRIYGSERTGDRLSAALRWRF